MTATDTYLNEIDAFLDALATNPDLGDSDVVTALVDIRGRVDATVQSLTAPMTHDQRRALFAVFTNVFGSSQKAARKVFTRLALGRPATAPVSWAEFGDSNGQGALTQREASKVLDALSALEAALR